MSLLNVVGLDPSMANFGMVKGILDLNTGMLEIQQMILQSTKSDKANKKSVRKNSDDLFRARLLHNTMTNFIDNADLIFAEIPVGSQTARAMTSYGMCIGVLASISKALIQVTPTEVKVVATGNKTASKADMIAWAMKTYPNADWLMHKRKGAYLPKNDNEHLADAIAAIHAGVLTDEFKQARSIYLRRG